MRFVISGCLPTQSVLPAGPSTHPLAVRGVIRRHGRINGLHPSVQSPQFPAVPTAHTRSLAAIWDFRICRADSDVASLAWRRSSAWRLGTRASCGPQPCTETDPGFGWTGFGLAICRGFPVNFLTASENDR